MLRSQIRTPALLVDMTAMESNLKKMAAFFAEGPTKLRPHYKNHKCVALARRQLAQGANGITCATLSEAEVLAGSGIQGILVKAPIHAPLDRFRNAQLVKARVVWSTAPSPTVPVLAVTRIGGQSFVYVVAPAEGGTGTVAKQRAVVLGDTIGNDYSVTGGLKPGEKVIISGIQFLVDGTPIQPTS